MWVGVGYVNSHITGECGWRIACTGFTFKIKTRDGDDFDVEANQHNDFITAAFDEFASFLRALGATKPDKPHPNPVERFLDSHPGAKTLLATRTYPISYAQATCFGINSLKFTNAKGQSAFVRYRLASRAGERHLTPEERKAQEASYLQDDIASRVPRRLSYSTGMYRLRRKGTRSRIPPSPGRRSAGRSSSAR